MSEFMGLVKGVYDAKEGGDGGFVKGGGSLHNCMSAHGPEASVYKKETSRKETKPVKLQDTLAFMFESRYVMRPTAEAAQCAQYDYYKCWQGIEKRFKL